MVGIAIIIRLRADCFDRTGDRLIAALWLGIVLLANGLLLISLGLPLSPVVGLAIAIGVSLLLLSWSPVRAEIQSLWTATSLPVMAMVISCSLLAAVYMTSQVTWFDTGLYHFGAIRWLSEYGTVPGLALLIDNLGFTSSWFALAAPFSVKSIAPRISAMVNGFVFLIFICHGLLALWYWWVGKARIADKFMLIFLGLVLPALLFTPFMSTVLVSSSPDIPVIFLTGIMAWSILTLVNRPDVEKTNLNSRWDASLIPLLLALGAVSIKLSALPLLPIAFLFYWQRHFLDVRRVLIGSGLSILLLSPLMIVSVMTSGCPFYPSSALCMDVPWRVSTEVASRAIEIIRIWDHNFGDVPPGANRFFLQFWEWLKFARFNVVMLLLLVMSALVMVPTFRAANKQKVYGTPWLFGCSFIGMIFILIRAPMIRFGLGYFVMVPAVATAVLGTAYLAKYHWQLPQYFSRGTIYRPLSKSVFVGVGLMAALIIFQPDIQSRLFLPPAMPTNRVEPRQSNDVRFVTPVSDNSVKCWAAPIPCTPYGNLSIRLRDPSQGIKAGFLPGEVSP